MSALASSEILVVLAITLGFVGVLLATMQYYYARRAMRYDTNHQRVELEMMRKSVESRMYELTEKLMATEARWSDMNHLLLSSQQRQSDAGRRAPDVLLTPFLQASGVTEVDIQGDSRLVFVLTPFHPEYREAFETIAEVCRSVDLIAKRGDEEAILGEVFPHILRLIVRARFIIANIDGRNPNVLYELGLAHGLGKQTILVARRPEDVPFDVRAKRLVVYQTDVELRDRLRSEIAKSIMASEPA